MAVTSLRIANAASGNRIQAVDAVELDGASNATVMERVVSGSLKIRASLGNATRGNLANVTAADSFDLTSLPADLTGNLISVGDGCLLVVVCEMIVSTGTITITPIAFDNQGIPVVVAPFESKTASCSYDFRRGSGSGNYTANLLWWDTKGAYKIGLHVSAVSSGNGCKLWGFIL